MEDELCLLGVVRSTEIQKIETSFQKPSCIFTYLRIFLIHLDMIYSFILFLHFYLVCDTERVCTINLSPMDRQTSIKCAKRSIMEI